MRERLPKLVGIERSFAIVLPNGDRIRSTAEEAHAGQLAREAATAAVHYTGPVRIEIEHPDHLDAVELSEDPRRAPRGPARLIVGSDREIAPGALRPSVLDSSD